MLEPIMRSLSFTKPAAGRLPLLAIMTGLLLSACAIAAPYSDKEQAMVNDMDIGKYQPASRTIRDNIETQSTLAQATFWSREYQLNPADLESAIKLSASVRKLGNATQAVEIAQQSRAMHPRDPYLTAEYAAGLIAAERGNEAIKPLNEGLRVAPQYARLWSLMGAALDQGEKYAEARKFYDRALRITPNDPNILANIGLSYALEGDAATAETWLRRASALPGAGQGVERNLALVMELQGKTPDTPAAPQMAQRRAPQPQGYSPMQGNTAPQGYAGSGRANHYGQPSAPKPQAPSAFGQGSSRFGSSAPSRSGLAGASSAMDAARAAARQGQGRKVVVGEGQAAPQSSVLNNLRRNVGPRSAYSAPPQSGYGSPQAPQGAQPNYQVPAHAQPPHTAPAPYGYGQPAAQPGHSQPPAMRRAPARRR